MKDLVQQEYDSLKNLYYIDKFIESQTQFKIVNGEINDSDKEKFISLIYFHRNIWDIETNRLIKYWSEYENQKYLTVNFRLRKYSELIVFNYNTISKLFNPFRMTKSLIKKVEKEFDDEKFIIFVTVIILLNSVKEFNEKYANDFEYKLNQLSLMDINEHCDSLIEICLKNYPYKDNEKMYKNFLGEFYDFLDEFLLIRKEV